jgi:hypothetical protein
VLVYMFLFFKLHRRSSLSRKNVQVVLLVLLFTCG